MFHTRNILLFILLLSACITHAQGIFIPSGAEIGHFGVWNFKTNLSVTTARTATPGFLGVAPGATFQEQGTNNKFVDGYVKKYGNESFVFPLGAASRWMPLQLTLAQSSLNHVFASAWIEGDPSTTNDPTNIGAAGGLHPVAALGNGIAAVFPLGQWDWLDVSNTGNGSIVSVPDSVIPTGFAPRASMRLVGWNGSSWINLSDSSGIQQNLLSGRLVSTISAIAIGRSFIVRAGSIQHNQVYCNAVQPQAITSSVAATADTIVQYRWLQTTDSMQQQWQPIPGAVNFTYQPPLLQQTTWFKRIAIAELEGKAYTDSSNTIAIYINKLQPGSIGIDQQICLGGDPQPIANLQSGVSSGQVQYTWWRNSGTVWEMINGATDSIYDPPAGLTQTTLYRRDVQLVTNNIACVASSNIIKVDVLQQPSVSLVSIAPVNNTSTSMNLQFSNIQADSFAIVPAASSAMPGFLSTSFASFGNTNIATIPIPRSTPGMYNFQLLLKNISGCASVQTFGLIVTDASPFNLALVKSLDSMVLQPDGSYHLQFSIKVNNISAVDYDSVQVSDYLAAHIPTSLRWSLLSVKGSNNNLRINPLYNGNTDTSLLLPGSKLLAGTNAIISLQIKVFPAPISTPFVNIAYTRVVSGIGNFRARATASAMLRVPDVIVSGLLTPNNDGVNDVWIIVLPPDTRAEVQVFNRWGQLVFEDKDYKNTWRGIGERQPFMQQNLSDGTYFYTVRTIHRINGAQNMFRGFITLKRQ